MSFDELDRSRCSKLDDWLPVEAASGLFEELTEDQTWLRLELNEIQMADELTRSWEVRLVEVNRQLRDLELVKKQLGMIASDEIAAGISLEAMLDDVPGIDLLHLYEK